MNRRAKETDMISLRKKQEESPYLRELSVKIVDLYPIEEDTIIPENA